MSRGIHPSFELNLKNSSCLKHKAAFKEEKLDAFAREELNALTVDVMELKENIRQLIGGETWHEHQDKNPPCSSLVTSANFVNKTSLLDRSLPNEDTNEESDNDSESIDEFLERFFQNLARVVDQVEYEWFTDSINALTPYMGDIKKDPNNKNSPVIKVGQWSWGRLDKYYNVILNGIHDLNDQKWRTIGKDVPTW